jgi:hypothetical protein
MLSTNHVRLTALLLVLFVASCNTSDNKPDSEKTAEEVKEKKEEWKYASLPISHQKWDDLLKAHVNDEGRVDYKGMAKDEAKLDEYLALLSNTPIVKDEWNEDQQMAYWINAYNAYTVKLILNHYPVKSIKDIGPETQVVFINTPWDIKFFEIGDKKYDLNKIEQGTLRKRFKDDPRFHFALVCAAKSCPNLRNEAYVPEILSKQLDDQGRHFMNNPAKNKIIDANHAKLSPYFDWYKKDFKRGDDSVVEWVNKYSDVKLNKGAEITFMDYDWSLNEQEK